MDRLIGHVIENFTLQSVVGQGRLGIVYRAYHADLQSYAAVKVLRPEYAGAPGFYRRFLQEARTAARLNHPGIVDVINFGRYLGNYYLMMAYVEGPSLRQLMNGHPNGLPLADALRIFVQIADVLAFAHAAGVLHRDVKPDNILLARRIRLDQPYRVIVTDFGLVKLAENSKGEKSCALQTQAGASLGTPAYMSAEQCRGEKLDGRADLYSLGIMLYECVSGARPYPVRNVHEAARFHSRGNPPPLRASGRQAPAGLDSLARRLLDPNRDGRPTSGLEVAGALEKIVRSLDAAEAVRPKNLSPLSPGMLPATTARQPGGGPAASHQTPRVVLPAANENSFKAGGALSLPGPDGLTAMFAIQVLYNGRLAATSSRLPSGPIIVGRDPAADIILDGPERFVSRRHCELQVRGERVLIRDLSSTNGTFLGQARLQVDTFYEWRPATPVHLGPFVFILHRQEAQPSA